MKRRIVEFIKSIRYRCNKCVYFRNDKFTGVYYCEKGNIYPSKKKLNVCIDCEYYKRKGDTYDYSRKDKI